jgi:hypothetical protein
MPPVGDRGTWGELLPEKLSQYPPSVPLRPPPLSPAQPRAPPAIA